VLSNIVFNWTRNDIVKRLAFSTTLTGFGCRQIAEIGWKIQI